MARFWLRIGVVAVAIVAAAYTWTEAHYVSVAFALLVAASGVISACLEYGYWRGRRKQQAFVSEGGAASIAIARRSGGWSDVLRSYVVEIDGHFAGRLREGQAGRYDIEPGEHQLRLRIDWAQSRMIRVDLRPGETAEFRCGPRNPLLALYWITLGSHRYIKLEPDRTTDAAGRRPQATSAR